MAVTLKIGIDDQITKDLLKTNEYPELTTDKKTIIDSINEVSSLSYGWKDVGVISSNGINVTSWQTKEDTVYRLWYTTMSQNATGFWQSFTFKAGKKDQVGISKIIDLQITQASLTISHVVYIDVKWNRVGLLFAPIDPANYYTRIVKFEEMQINPQPKTTNKIEEKYYFTKRD